MAGHRLTQEDILRYAELSTDRNPLHVDEAAAKASPFGGIVAHGFLLLGCALKPLAERDGFPKSFQCSFRAPGRPGDVVEAIKAEDGSFEIRAGDRVLVTGRMTSA